MAVHQPGSTFFFGEIFTWQRLEGHQCAVGVQTVGLSMQLFKYLLVPQMHAIKITNSEHAILMLLMAIMQTTDNLYISSICVCWAVH